MTVPRCITYYPDGSIYMSESRIDNVRDYTVIVYERGVYYDVRALPNYMSIYSIYPSDKVIAFLEYDESGLITVIAHKDDTGLSCLYGPNHVCYDLETNNIQYISDNHDKNKPYTLHIIWYDDLNKFKSITYINKRTNPTRNFVAKMWFHKNGLLDKIDYEIFTDVGKIYEDDYPYNIYNISRYPSGEICEVKKLLRYKFYEC